MPLRLLPKYEIDKKRAEETRQRMEEGLQIAGRVDTLRETIVSEEVAFEKYRIDRLKAIQEEIDIKQREKTKLDVLVVQAQKEYDLLRVPLDSEWESLEEERQQLSEDMLFVHNKSNEVEEFDLQNQKERNILYLESLRIEDMKRDMIEKTSQNLAVSEEKRVDAETLLAETNKKVEKVERAFKRKEKEMRDREYDISVRERELHMQQESLGEQRKKLSADKRLLADRQAMLERTLNRQK